MFRYVTLRKILYWILLSTDILSPTLFCTLICISSSLDLTGRHHHHRLYRVAFLDIGIFCCSWVLPVARNVTHQVM